MTPAQAAGLVLIGLALTITGLVWLFGPWALVGSGLLLVALALLIPVKERRAEPVEPPVPLVG